MTKMLACVSEAQGAQAALEAGADRIELRAADHFAALPLDIVRQTSGLIAGRAETACACGAPEMAPDTVANAARALGEAGATSIAVGFFASANRAALTKSLASLATDTPLTAVLFADRSPDMEGLDAIATAGFRAVALDLSSTDKGRVMDYYSPVQIGEFFARAKALGLQVGVSGGLEAPDVSRLLHFAPDFLGFHLDFATMRSLVPTNGQPVSAKHSTSGTDKIFVRDFVLPVQIGAYSFERGRTQQVRFDVVAEIERDGQKPEDMRHVVSYDLIMDGIRAIVESGHVQLSEALAEAIADRVLAHPRVVRVMVRVEKLELGAGGVGVEIERGAARQN
ncbi:FolB domain-containing protein [Mesorhizobium sp. NBSH29]|uniref:(5-formylfuran-3-yl)methyl phosphate synthase n=1 Tax=Mesorhizobium sp. NBSH29 TaxID=2654249 RepID=UPI001896707B|nr:(5-formylfuran-3-yl)methyl phosphate synthase [Mesorhizobium sp. NBSH29]QPC88283.1 FolB domain-containing protein [Mesorhizobium sp. NBSH29]